MSKDYAKKTKKSASKVRQRNHTPGWVWLLTGTVLGAFIMFLAHLSGIAPVTPVSTKDTVSVDTKTEKNIPKPRFDFYKLLKEGEVIVPGDMPTPESDAIPATPSETPTTPVTDADTVDAIDIDTTDTNTTPANAEPSTITNDRVLIEDAQPAIANNNGNNKVNQASKPATSAHQQVYLLQVGSFKSREDTDRLRAELTLLNLHTQVEAVAVRNGEVWHRVIVGPFYSTSQLESARSTLIANNINPLVLKKNSD